MVKAIGLSKGAVYGNFTSKEDLALAAFNHNIRTVLDPLKVRMDQANGTADKLFAITNYYRGYDQFTFQLGGCPIIQVGADSNHANPALMERVRQIIDKLIGNMEQLIVLGQHDGSFNTQVHAHQFATRMYAMIEGAIFTTMMKQDSQPLKQMMNYIDQMIYTELIA